MSDEPPAKRTQQQTFAQDGRTATMRIIHTKAGSDAAAGKSPGA